MMSELTGDQDAVAGAAETDDDEELIGILQARVEDQDREIADLTRQLQGQPRRPQDVAGAAPWQPPETAPKDGTQILAWWPQTREYGVVRWSDEEGSWLEGAADYPDGFTHWMLPPAGPQKGDRHE
jgi:hypothetical protein